MDPYGVDPFYNPLSILYRSDAMQHIWQFYNSSDHSPELATSGNPFAFFARPAAGYEDGFPVFFPVPSQSFVLLLSLLYE